MGGVVGTITCLIGVCVLYDTGRPVVFGIAVFVTILQFASWQHMRYLAKILARQRIFVETLQSGTLATTDAESEAAQEYWDSLTRSIGMKDTILRDLQDVPDWISTVNLVSFLIGICLLVCGVIMRCIH